MTKFNVFLQGFARFYHAVDLWKSLVFVEWEDPSDLRVIFLDDVRFLFWDLFL
jgi:hypothetical protein